MVVARLNLPRQPAVSSRRIVSLLPAATEMVAALGALEELVAVSHECDFPATVARLPSVTATPVGSRESSSTIDAAVRDAIERGEPVIGVDRDALLEAQPDVILTQSLCEVCAVDGKEIVPLAAALPESTCIVSLGARDLDGVYADILAVGSAIAREAEAEELVSGMRTAIGTYRSVVASGAAPRVVCIEWTEPLYLAGHWVPELVAAAGAVDVGAAPGSPSVRASWESVEALGPDVLLVMLCGFDRERGRTELDAIVDPVARRLLATIPTAVIDGNAYTSRPGPRLAVGVEVIHSELSALLT